MLSELRSKRIFVCSPLSADTPERFRRNQQEAEVFCWYVTHLNLGVPYAPHLFFTRFLDDSKPEEREKGIRMGLEELDARDELFVFLRTGAALTSGMQLEVARALRLDKPVVFVDVETAFHTWEKTRGLLPWHHGESRAQDLAPASMNVSQDIDRTLLLCNARSEAVNERVIKAVADGSLEGFNPVGYSFVESMANGPKEGQA